MLILVNIVENLGSNNVNAHIKHKSNSKIWRVENQDQNYFNNRY